MDPEQGPPDKATAAAAAAAALMHDLGSQRREHIVLTDTRSSRVLHGEPTRKSSTIGTEEYKNAQANQAMLSAWKSLHEGGGDDIEGEFDGQAHRSRLQVGLDQGHGTHAPPQSRSFRGGFAGRGGRGGGNAGRSSGRRTATFTHAETRTGPYHGDLTPQGRRALLKSVKYAQAKGIVIDENTLQQLREPTHDENTHLTKSKSDLAHPAHQQQRLPHYSERDLYIPPYRPPYIGEISTGDKFLNDATNIFKLSSQKEQAGSTPGVVTQKTSEVEASITASPETTKDAAAAIEGQPSSSLPSALPNPEPTQLSLAAELNNGQDPAKEDDAPTPLLPTDTPPECQSAAAQDGDRTLSYAHELSGLEFVPNPTSEPDHTQPSLTLPEIKNIGWMTPSELETTLTKLKQGLYGLEVFGTLATDNKDIPEWMNNLQAEIEKVEAQIASRGVDPEKSHATGNPEHDDQATVAESSNKLSGLSDSDSGSHYSSAGVSPTLVPLRTVGRHVEKPRLSQFGLTQNVYDSIHRLAGSQFAEESSLAPPEPPPHAGIGPHNHPGARRHLTPILEQESSKVPAPKGAPPLPSSESGKSLETIPVPRIKTPSLGEPFGPAIVPPRTPSAREHDESRAHSSVSHDGPKLRRRDPATCLAIRGCKDFEEVRSVLDFNERFVRQAIHRPSHTYIVEFNDFALAEVTHHLFVTGPKNDRDRYKVMLVHLNEIAGGADPFAPDPPSPSKYGRNNASFDMKDPVHSSGWYVWNTQSISQVYAFIDPAFLERISHVAKVHDNDCAVHFLSHEDAKAAMMKTPVQLRASGPAVRGGAVKIDWLLPEHQIFPLQGTIRPPAPPMAAFQTPQQPAPGGKPDTLPFNTASASDPLVAGTTGKRGKPVLQSPMRDDSRSGGLGLAKSGNAQWPETPTTSKATLGTPIKMVPQAVAPSIPSTPRTAEANTAAPITPRAKVCAHPSLGMGPGRFAGERADQWSHEVATPTRFDQARKAASRQGIREHFVDAAAMPKRAIFENDAGTQTDVKKENAVPVVGSASGILGGQSRWALPPSATYAGTAFDLRASADAADWRSGLGSSRAYPADWRPGLGSSHAALSHAGPSHAGPSHAGLSHAGPSQAGPFDAGAYHAGPSDAGAYHAGPSYTGAYHAGVADWRPEFSSSQPGDAHSRPGSSSSRADPDASTSHMFRNYRHRHVTHMLPEFLRNHWPGMKSNKKA